MPYETQQGLRNGKSVYPEGALLRILEHPNCVENVGRVVQVVFGETPVFALECIKCSSRHVFPANNDQQFPIS